MQLYFYNPSKNNFGCCFVFLLCSGTSVTRVTATDADDPVYGNSAKLVYSILEGQPYFSIDQNSGEQAAFFFLYLSFPFFFPLHFHTLLTEVQMVLNALCKCTIMI